MALIHMAPSSTHRISTAQVFSNGNINISNRKNHVTGIKEYTCNNNICNMSGDLYDKNIETIHACILVNTCNSDMRHDINAYRASM